MFDNVFGPKFKKKQNCLTKNLMCYNTFDINLVIDFFHVAEHADHFQAIKKISEENSGNSLVKDYTPLFGKRPKFFRFFFR